ncbi:hypothetical protein ACLOJK_034252 [Asimina triloba]
MLSCWLVRVVLGGRSKSGRDVAVVRCSRGLQIVGVGRAETGRRRGRTSMMELMDDAMGGDGFGRGGAGRRRTDGAAGAWLGRVAGVMRD